MADEGSKEGSTWPSSKFNFEVDLGSELKGIPFQEVSGLDKDDQALTLKRGLFSNDNSFWKWMDAITMEVIERRTILIRYWDENNNVPMLWQLNNAWPTKISGINLTSDGNEVAVDFVQIAYEQIIINGTPS